MTMWEIMSCGKSPFSLIGVPETIRYLRQGKRLEQPESCPPYVYALMLRCWQLDPSSRPPFSEICVALTAMMSSRRDLVVVEKSGTFFEGDEGENDEETHL